ncbi:MAG: helix-turn-helix domain-containing protein [Methanocella sp.]
MRVVTLGDRLARLREQRGLILMAVADAVGITFTYLSMLEQGKRKPSREVLRKLAEFYGVSTDYLLGIDHRDSAAIVLDDLIMRLVWVPIIKCVPAGKPVLADENLSKPGRWYASEEEVQDGQYFYFIIPGRGSAKPGMALIKRQDTAEDEETVLVNNGDRDAVIKRIKFMGDRAVLYADPHVAWDEEEPQFCNRQDIRIAGLVKRLTVYYKIPTYADWGFRNMNMRPHRDEGGEHDR